MSVQNNDLANETTFNTSFMSRETDTSTVGKVALQNAASESGASVVNMQRFANSVASALGITTAEVYNFILNWPNNYVGTSGDTVLEKIDAIIEKFSQNTALGHKHTGSDGEGPTISAANLVDLNYYQAAWQEFSKTGVTGGSTVVTSDLTTKTPGGGNTTEGVITDAPHNRVSIVNPTDGSGYEDVSGNRVYGRLTEASGVWTLTYYIFDAGTETAYSFGSSTDIQVYFREVFTLETLPTIPASPEIGSLDITADVVDASNTQRGVVSTGTQTFAGAKTFNGAAILNNILRLNLTTDSSTTGANANVPNPNKVALRLTNASLTSIDTIASPENEQFLILINESGNSINVNDDTGATAAHRIYTGTGTDFEFKNNSAVVLHYDSTTLRWHMIGGGGGGGDVAGPASSVDGEIALFDGTTGKLVKRATGSGFVKSTSGVYSTAANVDLATEVTGTLPIGNGGTGQTTNTTAFNALSPLTTKGDIVTRDATNNVRLPVGNDGELLLADSTQTTGLKWSKVSGVKNYILNGDAESTSSGWATYADAAALLPVDGTGGTANITWTRSTSSPLRGVANFLFTKDAANRQGQGASYDFSIDSADKNKMLQISFDYEISSGTYADNDLICYIYDVTNAVLIEPVGFQIKNVIGANRHSASFQSTSSTSYRLIIHTSSTSAIAYTVKFDDVVVNNLVYAQTEQVSMQVGRSSVQAISSATLTVVLFNSIGHDTHLAYDSGTGKYTVRLSGYYTVSASIYFQGTLSTAELFLRDEAGTDYIRLGTLTAGTQLVSGTVTRYYTAGETIRVVAYCVGTGQQLYGDSATSYFSAVRMPSGVQASETDTRVVAARYSSSAGQAIANATVTLIDYATKNIDTHSAVSVGGSWKFTAPIRGIYEVSCHWAYTTTTYAGTSSFFCLLYKNNATTSIRLGVHRTENGSSSSQPAASGSTLIELNAGDYIDFRQYQDNGLSENLESNAGANYINILRLSGPSQIAASESISARYTTAAAQAITGAGEIVDFGTKEWDSHSSVSVGAAWKFTAPISGEYEVSYNLRYGTGTFTVNTPVYARLYKNGVGAQVFGLTVIAFATSTDLWSFDGVTKVKLLAGEYIQIYAHHGEGTDRSLIASAVNNWVEISRVGNY